MLTEAEELELLELEEMEAMSAQAPVAEPEPVFNGFTPSNPANPNAEIAPPVGDTPWFAQENNGNVAPEKNMMESYIDAKSDLMPGMPVIQGMGRGVADLAGSPGDIGALLLNTLTGGVDKITGTERPLYQSPIGSDAIAENVTPVIAPAVEFIAGQPMQEYDDMDGLDKLKYNMARFGTGAGAGGIGLASRARKVDDLAEAGSNIAEKFINRMSQPYKEAPVRQVVDDTLAGAGAGAGLTAAENIAPDSPFAQLIAMLTGSAGASTGSRMVEGLATAVPSSVRNSMDVQLPDGETVSRRTRDNAATLMQNFATDPKQARDNIAKNTQEAQENNITPLTSGAASDDVALSSLEVGERTRNNVPYEERDQQIRTDLSNVPRAMVDEAADVTAPQTEIKAQGDKLVQEATDQADLNKQQLDTKQREKAVTDEETDAVLAPTRAELGEKGNASSAIDDQIGTEGALGDRTKAKNEAFEESAEGAFVNAKELLHTIEGVEDSKAKLSLNDSKEFEVLKRKVSKYISSEGSLEGPNSTAGMIPAGEVLKLRRELDKGVKSAQKAGDYDKADMYKGLKSAINDTINLDPTFKDANVKYKEEYAPFFAEGTGKEFRDTVQRDGDRRGKADTNKIADMFLGGSKTRDNAADLKRIVDIAPDPQAAENAVKKYFAADLARLVNRDKVSPKTISDWISNNSDKLDEFPEVKSQFEQLQKDVASNTQKSNDLMLEIKDLTDVFKKSEKDVELTKRRIEKGVFGNVVNSDPDKYVGTLLRGDNPSQKIKEVKNLIKNNPEAEAGFKRAFTEHMIEKTTGSNAKMVDGDGEPLLLNQVVKFSKENKKIMSEIYTPDEMNALNRMEKMLGSYGNLGRRSAVGSDTAQKQRNETLMNALEAGLKLKYGVLVGGSMTRSFKIAGRLLPDQGAKTEGLVARAMLDPELAVHLLDQPVKQIKKAKWNKRLNQLLGVAEFARETNEDLEEENE